ncbi:MAG: element excision factor XisI family protein [Anaerolineae bacterium]|nr:element excision factor XisI family protein [Anaerolineae bacterium]MDQ7034974.1 element excision factor XisI family protein [Anaerolineae bacterium]
MDTTTLRQILLAEMRKYAGEGFNAFSHLTISEDEKVYAIIDFADVLGKRVVGAVLIARLIDNMIYIDLDHNDKMLVDALLAHGVPEDQIILAYQQDKTLA